jgi:membrane protein required for beta-lactamase induction
MYLVAIAWTYVVLMMAVVEATSPSGTLLGAIVTFVLYGVLPLSLVLYCMGTPLRRRAIRSREAMQRHDDETSAARAAEAAKAAGVARATGSDPPDASRHAAADAVSPVRKKP